MISTLSGTEDTRQEFPYAWSDKQRRLADHIIDGDDPSIIVSGPVQSGKSVMTTFAFMARAACYSGCDFILASRSERQLKGSTLKYAAEAQSHMGRSWRSRDGYYEGGSRHGGINRFYTLTGSDSSSEGRARSFTCAGAMLEEAALLPETFINSVADRCSVPGALVLAVTNPDSDKHHLYTDWIQKGVPHYGFELADNPILTDEWIASAKNRYHGHAKRRMVYGEWCAAEGMIYPFVPIEEVDPSKTVKRWYVGADWAHSGYTHAVLLADYGDYRHVVSEWRHNGQRDGILNDLELAQRIRRNLCGSLPISFIVSDPSAPNFRKALEYVFKIKAHKAENTVAPGIQFVRAGFETNRLVVSPNCPELIKELNTYRWDERMALIGEDRPIKANDHGADALRYVEYSVAQALLQKEKKKASVQNLNPRRNPRRR